MSLYEVIETIILPWFPVDYFADKQELLDFLLSTLTIIGMFLFIRLLFWAVTGFWKKSGK